MAELQTALSEYVTIDVLARELGVSTRTIRRWRTLRIGPPHLKCGPRRVLYKLDQVREWLDAQAAGGRSN
jgi:DNA-binding transcriptional MerR regulator